MAAERLSMRKIKEVLRLQAAGQRKRAIARSLSIGHSTVREYLASSRGGRSDVAAAAGADGAALEARLFPSSRPSRIGRPLPDWSGGPPGAARPGRDCGDPPAPLARVQGGPPRRAPVQPVLRALPAVAGADGPRAAPGAPGRREGLRRLRRPDGAGDRPRPPARSATRRSSSACSAPAASRTREACESQELPEWIGAHMRMFEYFGGVPDLVVPDNLKTGVRHACYYEPDSTPPIRSWPLHYGTAVLPTRTRQAPRQGQGRGGGAAGRALDPGPAAQPHLLRPRGAEPRRSAGSWTCSTTGPSRSWRAVAPLALRGAGAPGASAAAGASRYEFAQLEEGPGQHRLPHRRPRPLLQRAPPPRARAGRRAPHRSRGRDLPRRTPRRGACAQPQEGGLHHGPRAPAEGPPEAPRVDALAHHRAGRRRPDPARRELDATDPGDQTPPRAGVSSLPRAAPARRDLLGRPARGRLCSAR